MFWVKIGVLYFLCFEIMHFTRIAPDRDIERLTRIYSSTIWSKLLDRSVSIGGLENNELKNIFTPDYRIEGNNVDRTAEVMYFGLKCHCADSIKHLHKTMYAPSSEETVSDYRRNITVYDEISLPFFVTDYVTESFFKTLNENLALTITLLFEMSDSIESLRNKEWFLLKALISMHLYVDRLKRYKFHGKNRKATLFTATAAGSDTMWDDQIGIVNAEKHLTDPKLIRRMILQMMNLIERFTVENCVANETDGQNDHEFDDHVGDLTNLLRNTRGSYGRIEGSLLGFDADRASLRFCFDGRAEIDHRGKRLLCECLSDAFLIDERQRTTWFRDMFNESERACDVRTLRAHLGSVYRALKKIIFLKVKDVIEEYANSKGDDLDPDAVRKLLTVNCPVGLVRDLEILLHLAPSHQVLIASKMTYVKLESLSDVRLPIRTRNEITRTMSLQEIIDCVVGDDFKQFWWVLDLLERDSEKQSDYVHGPYLEFISDVVVHSDKHVDELLRQFDYKCTSLRPIYHNMFRLKIMIDRYRGSVSYQNLDSAAEDIFFKIREHNSSLSDHLSKVVKTLSSINYLSYKDDFLKILMVMIGNLENAYYTEFHCEDCENEVHRMNFYLSKTHKLSQFGDYVINLLDNYQIRNCKIINNRGFVDSEFGISELLNHNVVNSIFLLSIPIAVSEIVDVNESYEISSQLTLNQQFKDLTEEDIKIYIPIHFYNVDFLNSLDLSLNDEVLKIFSSSIHFNCHGHVKNVFTHHIGLPNYTLSLNYFVEFEKVLLKFILSSFYLAFISIYDGYLNALGDDQDLLTSKLEIMTFYLEEFISIEYPGFCNVYVNSIKIICDYYRSDNSLNTLVAYSVIVVVMAIELDKLEVLMYNKHWQILISVFKVMILVKF